MVSLKCDWEQEKRDIRAGNEAEKEDMREHEEEEDEEEGENEEHDEEEVLYRKRGREGRTSKKFIKLVRWKRDNDLTEPFLRGGGKGKGGMER